MLKNYRSLVFVVLIAGAAYPQSTPDPAAMATVTAAARAMGIGDLGRLGSFLYSGTGTSYAFGQGAPAAPGPRSPLTRYERVIDFDAAGSMEIISATDSSGKEQTRTIRLPFAEPYGRRGRQYEIWITPIAFLKAASAGNATSQSVVESGKKFTVISIPFEKKYRITGYIGPDNLIDRITTTTDNPVLGDMKVEAKFSSYTDFHHGLIFPAHITESAGGYPVFDLTVTNAVRDVVAQVNELFDYSVSGEGGVPTFRGPLLGQEPPVTADQVLYGDDVYYFGVKLGSHDDPGDFYHTVVMEFNDYLVAIEAPLDEVHAEAVIREIRKNYGDKPIRYVVNSHAHFDSSGGLRAFVAAGATILTQSANKAFLEKVLSEPRTLAPDKLSALKNRKIIVEGVAETRVITDGTHTLQLYHVSSAELPGLLISYIPKEKLLVESDLYVARDPRMEIDNTGHISNIPKQPDTTYAKELVSAVDRLKLDFSEVLCLRGRAASKTEMLEDIAAAAH